jgi:hypothetical protein
MDIECFRFFLKDLCVNKGINFIAEEVSDDSQKKYLHESTVAEIVGNSLNIQHCYIDLDCTERDVLGISRKSLKRLADELASPNKSEEILLKLIEGISHPIRERKWVLQILMANLWPAIFICGPHHVVNVKHLLDNIVDEVVILEYDFSPNECYTVQ